MADEYFDAASNTFWCRQVPAINYVANNSRMRCTNLIIDNCSGGAPGGGTGGLQGDCYSAYINNGLILCDPEDSWNCHLCPNDLPYFSPVMIGDPFMFQFQQWDPINGQSGSINPNTGTWGQNAGWGTMVQGYVYDCCTDALIGANVLDFSIDDFVGVYATKLYNGTEEYRNIQQIKLDLQLIYNAGIALNPNWDGCFYIKFFFFDSNNNPITELTTEPYKFLECNPEDTILLEGVNSKKDCFGFFYGDPVSNPNQWLGIGTPFQYRNVYRVKGSFELVSFEIEKEFVGNRETTVTSSLSEIWQLRTSRVPSRVARLISSLLSSTIVYVDGIDYVADGSVTKNNDIGSQWFIDAKLKKINCSKTSSCD